MPKIAEDRDTRAAAVNKQPSSSDRQLSTLTMPSIAEDRSTRAAAVDAPSATRVSGSPRSMRRFGPAPSFKELT